MWSVRILNGPRAGDLVDLGMGRNLVGRSSHCDVHIPAHGISKEHCEINVYQDKIMVTDLKSSNGTFINGIRIQNGIVRYGDKIGVYDILLDIIPRPEIRPKIRARPIPQNVAHLRPTGTHPPMTASALGTQPDVDLRLQVSQPQSAQVPAQEPSAMTRAKNYLETVALPGVYKLTELMDFQAVLVGFVSLFIFLVTLLSMIPMVKLNKESVLAETTRRAHSLARNMALANQNAFLQGNVGAMNTHSAETEDGVKQAFIVQQIDGMIVAPASRAGRTSELSFVHRARKEIKSISDQIDDNTIAASYPIGLYDPNTGEPSVKAYAIVVYDISARSFDTARVISLFMQTIVIASVVGFIIFFFIFKLIEFPFRSLNEKLDTALREKHSDIQVHFRFPILQQLVGNINSLLTRTLTSASEDKGVPLIDKNLEAKNLVQLISLPAAALDAQGLFIAANPRFEPFSRLGADQLIGQGVSSLGDMALQQNINFLLEKVRENLSQTHSDQLEFSGEICRIHCQAFSRGPSPDYYLILITPPEEGTS